MAKRSIFTTAERVKGAADAVAESKPVEITPAMLAAGIAAAEAAQIMPGPETSRAAIASQIFTAMEKAR